MKKLHILALIIICLVFASGCQNHEEKAPAADVAAVPFQFRSDQLESYTIVYSKDNPDYFELANRLADQILNKYDVFLSTACDADSAPGKYEILLGDTNRCDRKGKVMEYSVTVADGKFQIHAGGSFSAEQAIVYLCQSLFNGQPFALDNGDYHHTSFLTNVQPVTDGSSARIMSANILADAFKDNAYRGAFYRAEIFAGMLVSYTPDVLGLQEVDESWNSALAYYLPKLQNAHGLTYSQLLSTYENKTNYTSLLYRSDKFEAEDSGVQVFSWWTDGAFNHNFHMRNISWAQFSSLEDRDSRFIVANTHWSYRTEHADGNRCLTGSNIPIAVNELRMQCKEQTDTFLSSLKQNNPEIPILLTGDFNTSLSFFTENGWTPEGFEIISEAAKSNGKALALVPSSGHFDHIFGAGSYTIQCYGLFKDVNQHGLLTDHPLVYTDFVF